MRLVTIIDKTVVVIAKIIVRREAQIFGTLWLRGVPIARSGVMRKESLKESFAMLIIRQRDRKSGMSIVKKDEMPERIAGMTEKSIVMIKLTTVRNFELSDAKI
jgi:hypothetical protein